MEANELRIGNLVNYAYFPNVPDCIESVNIIRISKTHLSYKAEEEEVTYSLDNFQPIPLNEEWLLRFGFVNSDYDETKFNPTDEYADQFEYTLESGVFHRQLVCKPIEGWIVRLGDYESQVEIKYVHQLQNLFFALKGKELTLK